MSRTRSSSCESAAARSDAFTLIELLIVIAIIGILIAAMGFVGSRVFSAQKRKHTESIIRTVQLAIDQFAAEDPLKNRYNGRPPTFGPYPPYQLGGPDNGGNVDSVREAVEPYSAFDPSNALGGYTLANRLWRDLGDAKLNVSSFVNLPNNDQINDDSRALFTYLKIYSPGVLDQVPPDQVRPLSTSPEVVNPRGTGTGGNAQGLVEVFGIYDAWDVPIDYFLFVKLEWRPNDAGVPTWVVTDRRPGLRSRGLPADQLQGTDPQDSARTWIFNQTFPTPTATIANNTTGMLRSSGGSQYAGWVRAIGRNEEPAKGDTPFKYVPTERGGGVGGG